MKTKIMSLTIAVAFATAFSAVAGGAGESRSANPAPTQFTLKPIPASAVHHGWQAPRVRNKNGTSLNWSGYAVTNNPLAQNSSVIETTKGKGNGKGHKPGGSTTPTFTAVTGSWIVPAVSSISSANTYSSAWVGIDGYNDSTVEQIGTEQDVINGAPQYYAWFEMYPKWGYEIVDFPVNVGDTITASVGYTSKGNFTLTIVNESVEDGSGNGTFTITQRSPSAQRLSTEWVMEAPWSGGVLPLADFGTIDFFDCGAATSDGNVGPIDDSAWGYDPMTMATSSGTTKAVPSGLSLDGTSFSVTWNHE